MYNFVFVILNVVSAVVDITQSLIQYNSKWFLQLINGASKDLQKLLEYFSGTTIFTFLNTLPFLIVADSPMKLDLYLKYVELAVETLPGFSSFVRGNSIQLF